MASPASQPRGSPSAVDTPPPAAAETPSTIVARVVRSFGFAVQGIVTITWTQPNFVIHLVAAVAALGAGVLLRLTAPELALIVLTIVVVLATEALNTAIEAACDVVSPAYHPLIKRAKDASAAAVLIAAIGAVVIAALVFLPHVR